MITKYVVELKPYSFREMCGFLECSDNKATRIIKELKSYKVLKELRSKDINRDLSDLIDESLAVEEVDANGNLLYYAFCYVGVIKVARCIFLCVPKYLTSTDNYHDKLKEIIRVLKHYNSKKQIVSLFNDIDNSLIFNDLAVYLFLLEDYFENGSYTNEIDILEINGNGAINWNRTINSAYAIIQSKRPYYTELYTHRRRKNEYDYFKRLHECVLSIASNELVQSGIADLFDLSPVHLSEQKLDDFGEKEYILYRIENELNSQFNTRKQTILKTIYAYISQTGNTLADNGLSMFGTNAFNLVWEDVCSQVLNNMLDLPIDNHDKTEYKTTLRSLIAKPKWYAKSVDGSSQLIAESDTLEPDIVVHYRRPVDGRVSVVIFDAKYYSLTLENGVRLSGNPGIESISKQYFYELAFSGFMKEQGIVNFANCFLFPAESGEFENIGFVEFGIFNDLSRIQVLRLPADQMFKYYINGTILTADEIGVSF